MEYTFETTEAPWADIHEALRNDVHPAEEMAGEVPTIAALFCQPNPVGAAGPALGQVFVEADAFWGYPDRETLGDA